MAASSEAAATAASNKKGAAPSPPTRPRCARDALVFAAGVAAAVLALLGPATSVLAPAGWGGRGGLVAFPVPGPADGPRTFYDDPDLSYAVVGGRRLTGWDAKRAAWLSSRGLGAGAGAGVGAGRRRERVVMVSGSQPEPCRGAGGDHLLLRFLKNKVDYCRLHGIELLYNNAHLEPSMLAYWAKIPAVRAAMLAHPDAEWVWWVDADAVFTDMDFSLPLAAKYAAHNLVLYGWPKEVYENRRWLGLNAGVFLIRNCQWSLDFLDEWARMGPAYPDHAAWGKKVKAALTDRDSDVACDQSALAYLLITGRERWGDKVYLGTDYYFQGYFVEIVGKLAGVAARYEAAERGAAAAGAGIRRRHAEMEHLRYAAARNAAVRAAVPGPDGGGQSGWRRPLITHFTGCNPCGGRRNPMYSRDLCEGGMRRALAFADDQVLRAYGFRHAGLLNDTVLPVPFDFPAARRNR